MRHRSGLAAHEDSRAHEAAQSFAARRDSTTQQTVFTFAERSHWPGFQDLLDSFRAAPTEDSCELSTEIEQAVVLYAEVITGMLKERAAKQNAGELIEGRFVSSALKGCIFVGRETNDLSSIAGALGAAALFEGVAAKSETGLDSEILYALQEVAELEEPQLYDSIPGSTSTIADMKQTSTHTEWKTVCLVDHNEVVQMVAALQSDPYRRKRIVGLIDHHALSESFSSEEPLLIDTRPWGSVASIIAHL
jgi:hypothetical protein